MDSLGDGKTGNPWENREAEGKSENRWENQKTLVKIKELVEKPLVERKQANINMKP